MDDISYVSPWLFTYLILLINVSVFFHLRSLAIAQTGKIIQVLKLRSSLFELHSTNMNEPHEQPEAKKVIRTKR